MQAFGHHRGVLIGVGSSTGPWKGVLIWTSERDPNRSRILTGHWRGVLIGVGSWGSALDIGEGSSERGLESRVAFMRQCPKFGGFYMCFIHSERLICTQDHLQHSHTSRAIKVFLESRQIRKINVSGWMPHFYGVGILHTQNG